MELRLVLDTNAVLYLLGGRLAEPLPEAEYFVSVIMEMELLSYPSLDAEAERGIRELLSRLMVIGITEPVKETAVRLRRKHNLRLPDAVIAATAMSLAADLVTNDRRLCQVPGLSCRQAALTA